MSFTIRPLEARDRAGWEALFTAYAEFYQVTQTPLMRETVFDWLMDTSHSSNAFVAEADEGTLIGLTHYRPFASTLRVATNAFLDDLFVSPAARGTGAADALIDAVVGVARQNGWAVVRWITADNNYRARSLYDKVAVRTPWITYDIRV